MRTDPALQARNSSSSSRFSVVRALVAALVLAVLAILPVICRGASDGGCCALPDSLVKATTSSLALADGATTETLPLAH